MRLQVPGSGSIRFRRGHRLVAFGEQIQVFGRESVQRGGRGGVLPSLEVRMGLVLLCALRVRVSCRSFGPALKGRPRRIRSGSGDNCSRWVASTTTQESTVQINNVVESIVTTAKIFWSGDSQAVRLPQEFRFPPDTDEVVVRREGDSVVLEPVKRDDWPEDFWKAFEGMPTDFERPPQVSQVREDLDS